MKASDVQKGNCNSSLQANNLTYYFGKVKALDNFTINIPCGSVCGLIGNNGAGKTTAIHAMLGFLPASKGQISILGLDPNKHNVEALRRVGFFPEKIDPYPWLTVKSLFQIGAYFYPNWNQATCDKLCRNFDLDISKTIKQLTKGMFAKTKLIYALSHHPHCLLLDEPISGLDPASRDELISILRDLTRQQQVTTLISSHSLYELSDIATDICVIHKGRSLFSTTMKEINHSLAILEVRRPGFLVTSNLQELVIQTKIDDSVTQLLIRDKDHPLVRELIQQSNSLEVCITNLSLKTLFLFLTKSQHIDQD